MSGILEQQKGISCMFMLGRSEVSVWVRLCGDHSDTTLEFTLMSQAGMNYKQILASLTTNPARKFRDSDRTGRIAKDMKAEMVILSADPAEDVTALSKLSFTIRTGKVHYKER